MLAVAEVARLAVAGADELSRAIVAAGCARITLCARRDIWCLIDAEDYGWLTEHSWNVSSHRKTPGKFYAKRNEGPWRLTVYMHREIAAYHDPRDNDFIAAHMVHHRNGQSLDCRRANLEWVPGSVNSAIRLSRAAVPPLESIVLRLAQERAALVEIPF